MVLDNQQETLKAYIAGLFEGEGSIVIGKLNLRRYIQYRCNIQFTNTEVEIIEVFVGFCKANGIHYHVRPDSRKGRRICYQVSVTRTQDKIKFISILKQFFVGSRSKICEIAIEFLNLRMKFINGNNDELRDKENGRFLRGSTSFGEEYEVLFQRYKQLKDSSETTCRTLVHF